MTELIEEFLVLLQEENKVFYTTLAEKALSLGYKAKRDKTKHLSISFSSSKYKSTIMRFVCDKKPALRLKFFATKEYSKVFDDSIKAILERYDFKYTGCYGCGKCEGKKQGYLVNYEDGRKFFRCGFELIELIDLNKEITEEAVKMLETQTEYYKNK